jgi:hypothetical protein
MSPTPSTRFLCLLWWACVAHTLGSHFDHPKFSLTLLGSLVFIKPLYDLRANPSAGLYCICSRPPSRSTPYQPSTLGQFVITNPLYVLLVSYAVSLCCICPWLPSRPAPLRPPLLRQLVLTGPYIHELLAIFMCPRLPTRKAPFEPLIGPLVLNRMRRACLHIPLAPF